MYIVIVLLVLLILVSSIIGQWILHPKKEEYSWASSVLGLGIILLILSPLYYLKFPLQFTLIFWVGIFIIGFRKIRGVAPQIIAI